MILLRILCVRQFPQVGWQRSRRIPLRRDATTEGTLLRLHMQFAADSSASAAWGFLATLSEHPSHVFWPEGFSYTKFKVIRLGDRHALLITGSALEAANQELRGKRNNSRWQTLGPWRALYRPSP